MEKNNFEREGNQNNSKILVGAIFVGAGVLLLAYYMGVPIPRWIFSWQVILISIGLVMGIQSNFRNPGSLIMIAIGSLFLLEEFLPGLSLRKFIFPAILISIGLIFILRPRNKCGFDRNKFREPEKNNANESNLEHSESVAGERPIGSPEYLNINAAFGGVKKNVSSQNFAGGEISCFMGGAEINLLQADMQKPVVLNVNNIFGGTKIVIPSDWDVKNEVSAIFGGIEDKRGMTDIIPNANKTILLKGLCLFGGIEISNYPKGNWGF